MPVIVEVRVKPRAARRRVEKNPDGSLTVAVLSAPVEGKANAEVLELLSEYFGIPKSKMCIQAGSAGRRKLVRIED